MAYRFPDVIHRGGIVAPIEQYPPGLGQLGALQEEKLVFANALQAHAGLYAQLRDTVQSAMPAVNEFAKNAADYKAAIGKAIATALKENAFSGGFVGLAIITLVVLKKVEDENRGISKTREALAAIADVVRHTWAALFAYQRVTVGDLVDEGIMEEAAATSFGQSIGISSYALFRTYSLSALTGVWGRKIGMESYLSSADVRWKELVAALEGVEKKAIEVARWVEPKKSPAELFEYESLVPDVKKGFIAALRKASDDAKARRRVPGWPEQIFNTVVSTLSEPWIWFGVAGLVYVQFVGPTVNLAGVLDKLAYSSARLIQASAKAAAAGAAVYANVFKVSRLDEKKTEKESVSIATEASSAAIKTVGASEYGAAHQDIDRYLNYYQQTMDALKAMVSQFGLGLEELAKYIVIGAVVIGGAIVVSKVL